MGTRALVRIQEDVEHRRGGMGLVLLVLSRTHTHTCDLRELWDGLRYIQTLGSPGKGLGLW